MTVNDGIGKPIVNFNNKVGLSYEDMLMDDFVFDMDSRDVMVFLHMQKTGEYSLKLCIIQQQCIVNNRMNYVLFNKIYIRCSIIIKLTISCI